MSNIFAEHSEPLAIIGFDLNIKNASKTRFFRYFVTSFKKRPAPFLKYGKKLISNASDLLSRAKSGVRKLFNES
jgi:hypothetical protein